MTCLKKGVWFLLLAVFFLTGCDEGKIKVKFDCNGITKEYKVKKGSTFKCSLFGAEYNIKITDIQDDKFIIESNEPLTFTDDRGYVVDSNSIETIFEIIKGKKNILAVPLDGLQYTIEFEW